ncbi:MAG: hydrogenase iron-sulfur subunit, partial [Planctomycetes bacterium]|nr:hydrogenase iron-sulfur subunit [Planctomycetota bacterium]
LMVSAGVDPRRVHFSWVSASESQKFAETATEVVEQIGHRVAFRDFLADGVQFVLSFVLLLLEHLDQHFDRLGILCRPFRRHSHRLDRFGCSFLGDRRHGNHHQYQTEYQ